MNLNTGKHKLVDSTEAYKDMIARNLLALQANSKMVVFKFLVWKN